MAKPKAQPTKEEIATQKAALKDAISNLRDAVKSLKNYTFDLEGTDSGNGVLLVMDGDKVITQIRVKTYWIP